MRTLLASVGIAGLTVGIGWNGHGTATLGLFLLEVATAWFLLDVVLIALWVAFRHFLWRRRRCEVVEIHRFLSPNGGMPDEASSHADRSAGSRDRRGDPSRPLAHVVGHDQISKRMAHMGWRWP